MSNAVRICHCAPVRLLAWHGCVSGSVVHMWAIPHNHSVLIGCLLLIIVIVIVRVYLLSG